LNTAEIIESIITAIYAIIIKIPLEKSMIDASA